VSGSRARVQYSQRVPGGTIDGAGMVVVASSVGVEGGGWSVRDDRRKVAENYYARTGGGSTPAVGCRRVHRR